MKHLLLIASLLLSLSLPARAAGAAGFLSGDEHLEYSIRHSRLPGNVGTMVFQGTRKGADYNLTAQLDVSIAGLYSLNSLYTADFRSDGNLTPLKASRDYKEKKYWAKSFYNWTAPGTVNIDVSKSSRPQRVETLTAPGTIRDLLNLLWWLRTCDYDAPDGIKTPESAVLLDHDLLPVRIASVKKSTARYKGETVPVFEVSLSQDGKNMLQITLTDDARRTPLKFSIAFSFGTIRGNLAAVS